MGENSCTKKNKQLPLSPNLTGPAHAVIASHFYHHHLFFVFQYIKEIVEEVTLARVIAARKYTESCLLD